MGPLFYYRHLPTEPGLSEMRAAARRALELDERLGEAHVAMGIIHFLYEWDWPAAAREFKRSTELNPGDPHAFHMLANYYRAMRRLDEAIAARRRALELDPLNARIAISLAGDYMNARQLENAAEQYARAMDIDSLNPLLLGLGPNLPAGPAEVYERQGRHAEAVEEYARVAARRGAPPGEMAEMREAFASGGMPGFWRRWLAFEERAASGEPRPMRVAAIYARSGDIPQALAWLERAYREHDPGLVFIAGDPDWDALRAEPRFIAIMERMGL
jgi:tetratricopeptide (TPR) repeat protein